MNKIYVKLITLIIYLYQVLLTILSMLYIQHETKIERPQSSKCLSVWIQEGPALTQQLGACGTSQDPEQTQHLETLKTPEEFNTLIARFMLFPIFITLSSFDSFLPPFLTTLFLSCWYISILSINLGNMRSISISDTVWVKCATQIWGWRQWVSVCTVLPAHWVLPPWLLFLPIYSFYFPFDYIFIFY